MSNVVKRILDIYKDKWVVFLLFALAYSVIAVGNLIWTVHLNGVAPISPAATLSFIVMILYGKRMWPAMYLGGLLSFVIVPNDIPFIQQVSLVSINVVAVLTGKYILERLGVRRTQYDFEEAANKYRAIVETAVDGIVVIDNKSCIHSLNTAAEKMFGYGPGEITGQSVDVLIPHELRNAHHASMLHHEKTGERKVLGTPGVTVQALHKEGHTFAAHLAIAEWFVGGQRFYTGIIRDLTAEQQRDAARDLLTREVDHRAKNVLAVVQSVLQLSTGRTKADFIENVRGRITSLARAHSLLSQNKWEGASLFTILNEELGSHVNRIVLRGPPITLNTDSVQPVTMIIHELLTNAIKYGSLSVEEGGVTVSWDYTPDKNLMLEWYEVGGPKVQEPETKGFGSQLVFQLANHQLDGHLNKDWREDGLLVTLCIPNKAFKAGPRVDKSIEDPALNYDIKSTGQTVLIVEDNALLAMEMTVNLETAGYRVVGPMSTLEEGLKAVDNREDIQLAVLDINLAGVMSFPIAQALKDKGIPFVFCTGYEIPDTPLSLQDSPVMQKPINELALLNKLNELRPVT